ncbi:hypothetical protein [Sphingopyxis sp. RIFCSPHIGHO2_12_FULL_65_19]|uniref:hypothetical protein n=1 Tax=Sphingopyxis sp. RIFCSPHIGHO2_12_FULL_65_19 TaxID=1802172 RepID=UPI0025EF865D|nr:hypothetical protein [Sphingopyxis sp. RIFCSPHIGHO2_12_FULL_65_19]
MNDTKPQSRASLTAAINDLLREDFDGVPAAENLARALDKIVNSGSLPVREAILLDAIARALEGETLDGWRLALKGKKGPKRNKQEGMKREEIGKVFAENVAGGGWEHAIEAAREAKHKSPKEAYEREQDRLRIFMRARIPHEQRLEQLRPLCRPATPKE